MRRFIIKWSLLVAALILAASVTSLFMKGFTVSELSVASFFKMVLGVMAVSVLNATLGKILKFLTIPLNCMTLGLFSVLINAAMFMLAGSLGLGFSVDGFLPALVGSTLYSLFGAILHQFLPDKKDED